MPLTVVGLKGRQKTGRAPTLLDGYGGPERSPRRAVDERQVRRQGDGEGRRAETTPQDHDSYAASKGNAVTLAARAALRQPRSVMRPLATWTESFA